MSDNFDDVSLIQEVYNASNLIKKELHKRIVGQDDVIDDLLACFLAGGHSLLIGVPGLAKTMLVSSLAECLNLEFNRIQFTPDLMPTDITGSEILFENKASGEREFRFVEGPIFSNIVLADEINRTPPKTQSALLQAMQEKEVTSSGKTFPLPKPFWVLATQNPIEQEGTYPLPEAQQDRFMFSIEISYPDKNSEIEIVKRTTVPQMEPLNTVLSTEKLLLFKDLVWRVPVADSVISYAVSLARASRVGEKECPDSINKLLTWGAGPRASQFLILASKAYAALSGRPTADRSDVEKAVYHVLRHRLVRSFNAEAEGVSNNDIIDTILRWVK
jgi:MoxR-like ATPase